MSEGLNVRYRHGWVARLSGPEYSNRMPQNIPRPFFPFNLILCWVLRAKLLVAYLQIAVTLLGCLLTHQQNVGQEKAVNIHLHDDKEDTRERERKKSIMIFSYSYPDHIEDSRFVSYLLFPIRSRGMYSSKCFRFFSSSLLTLLTLSLYFMSPSRNKYRPWFSTQPFIGALRSNIWLYCLISFSKLSLLESCREISF